MNAEQVTLILDRRSSSLVDGSVSCMFISSQVVLVYALPCAALAGWAREFMVLYLRRGYEVTNEIPLICLLVGSEYVFQPHACPNPSVGDLRPLL
jgi:hypothetical protein